MVEKIYTKGEWMTIIAAASDSYEACKDMLKAYEQLRQEKPLLFNMVVEADSKLYRIYENACIKTEKAIVKAEGK